MQGIAAYRGHIFSKQADLEYNQLSPDKSIHVYEIYIPDTRTHNEQVKTGELWI